jgi:hypothetical protein
MAVNRLNVGATNQLLAKASSGQSTNILELQNTAGVTVAGVDASGNPVGGLAHPANFKNLVINGAMQVAQRSSSVASITTTSYNTADRFRTNIATLGTWTQSVENDAPTGSGFRKSLKMLCTTADASPAAADVLQIETILEGQNLQHLCKGTSSAKQLTLSFWVKSNVTGTYAIRLLDVDNSNRMASKNYTISASGTWEKKTITFAADTTGAFDNDNAASLYVSFWLAAGSDFTTGTTQEWNAYTAINEAPGQVNVAAATNNYWQITGVQFEVGSVATDYEFLPADIELARCQRYFYKLTCDTAGSYAQISTGYIYSGTAETQINMPVSMRTRPTAFTSSAVGTFYISAAAGAGAATVGPTIQRGTNETFQFIIGKTGLTNGHGIQVLQNVSDATFITASAEL